MLIFSRLVNYKGPGTRGEPEVLSKVLLNPRGSPASVCTDLGLCLPQPAQLGEGSVKPTASTEMERAEFLPHHRKSCQSLGKTGQQGGTCIPGAVQGMQPGMQLQQELLPEEEQGLSKVWEPRGFPEMGTDYPRDAGKSPPEAMPVFNHDPESTKQLQTHTRLAERLVKTERVIHKFTKIPCSTEQCDSPADRSNISIQTGFGAGAINIPAIFPASEHKDSFTVLIK